MNKVDMIVGKLAAIRDTLGKYKPSDLSKMPNRAFAENYNLARELALKECPDITEFAPAALIIKDPQGISVSTYVSGNYLEIQTYADELIRLIRNQQKT